MLIVQKFGGSSLKDPERLRHVAELCRDARHDAELVVVVSAMGGTTDTLTDRAREVNEQPSPRELDALVEFRTIEKRIHEDITYGEIYQDQDNLWNFMYFTGYLKAVGERSEDDVNYATLVIPNRETRYIYSQKIINWFAQEIVKKTDRSALFSAMLAGNARGFETEINKLLRSSISYYDSYEAFYHGFMAGLFVGAQDFAVRSNRESGDGRSDLLVLPVSVFDRAFVIELKAVKSKKGQKTVTREDMDNAADEALKQIEDLHYTDALMDEGYSVIGRYGIAFFRKDCRVHYLEGYPQEEEGQKEIFAKNRVAPYKPFRNAD